MAGGFQILVYHSVLRDGDRVERATQVSARAFQSQLAWFRHAGYEVVTLSRLFHERPAPGRGRLAITFDDGYEDNHAVAWPILSSHGMAATFFVTTDFIGDRARFNHDWQPRMMAWSQLQELAAAGMEIGSHSCAHPHLPALSPAALQREVTHSRSLLEDRLGLAVPSIAYPHGFHSPAVLDAVERAGYCLGCAVDAPGKDPRTWLALPRTMIREADRGARLIWKLSRGYQRLRGKQIKGRALTPVSLSSAARGAADAREATCG